MREDLRREQRTRPSSAFFALAVLARALREDGRPADYRHSRNEALDWFDAVPDDEREWCEADLAELAY
jgi:hypothetical protein